MSEESPTTLAPETLRRFRLLFLVAALYDGLLGLTFLFFAIPLFDALGIDAPETFSYAHLAAAFVAVQGLMYWFVYRAPIRNIDLVKVGIVYKAAYVLIAVYYAAIGEIPDSVFLWFAAADALFLAAFLWFLRDVHRADVIAGSSGATTPAPR